MPDMKELCADTSCNHPRDMHASLGGYCSICGCNRFYVNIKLSGDGSSVGAIVTNAQGGSQSKLDFDFTQLDADMLMRVARVLNTGAQKYGEKNWQKIPTHDHINHMIYHAIMANTSDTTEDHLANTICRAMFAMWTKQNDLVTKLETGLANLKMPSPYEPGIHWVLEPPFGYRKFDTSPSDSGPITAPMNALWCFQCPHDAKDHIITPNIEGDCLVCAKCGCRLQLLEDDSKPRDTWCERCKHPMSHHKDIDNATGCSDCSCVVYKAQQGVCKCGHHRLSHAIGNECRAASCQCLKFDPSTEAKSDQDKPSRSRPYGPGRQVYAPQEGNTDKTVSP